MNEAKIIVMQQPEKSETRKMREQHIEELMGMVEEINKAGRAIGRANLTHDFLMQILFVVGSVDSEETQEIIGLSPKSPRRSKR